VYDVRTNIYIDEKLIEEAKKLTGLKTKKDVVNLALEELIKNRRRKNLLDIQGKISFVEDYDYKQMRGNHDFS
jgi:Arc/MetJ family transcription regulator